VPPDSALSVHEFLAKKRMTGIPLPLCLLNLVSCYFIVFQKLKVALKGGRFNDITLIVAKLWGAVAEIQTVHFMECFEWWHNCWLAV
jgi:hypothetical protein